MRDVVADDTKLSFVSAYFTIHTYGVLGEVLEQAESLRFLFGEPRFVRSLDTENKRFVLDVKKDRLKRPENRLTRQWIKPGNNSTRLATRSKMR